mgnify:FL=1
MKYIIKFRAQIEMGLDMAFGLRYSVPCDFYLHDKGTLRCYNGKRIQVFYNIEKIEIINLEKQDGQEVTNK